MSEIVPTHFANRYEVLYKLGEGGNSIVYKAKDLNLNKDVAIKLLHPNASRESIVRLQKEATLTARLKHRYIASTLDFGLADSDTPYMVLEYVTGESLAHWISLNSLHEDSKIADIERAFDLFIQISLAMVHAHEKGILHRDLKPSNIMVEQSENSDQQVRVMDFGIAKCLEQKNGTNNITDHKNNLDRQQLTGEGHILGSPLYMSPEQALGQEVDERSDLYSLGCILFEMLTGSPPVHESTSMETLAKKTTYEAEFDSLYLSPCSESFKSGLEQLLRKCLAPNKEKRFASVKEMLEELQILLDSNSLLKDSRNLEELKTKSSKKSFPLLLCLAIVLVLLIPLGFLSKLKENVDPPVSVYEHSKFLNNIIEKGLLPEETDLVSSKNIKISDNAAEIFGKDHDDKDLIKLFQSLPPSVESLRIEQCSIDGSAFEKLGQLKPKGLRIARAKLRMRGLRAIAKIDTLTHLSIIYNDEDIDKSFFDMLIDKPPSKTINSLNFYQNTITRNTMEGIASLPRLANLRLKFDNIEEEALPVLGSLKNLEYIKLTTESFRPEMLEEIYRLKKLTSLDLSGLSKDLLNEALEKTAQYLPKLKSINIGDCSATGNTLQALKHNKNLRLLSFYNVKLDKFSMKQIEAAHQLESVLFRQASGLKEADFITLYTNKGLQRIYVDSTVFDTIRIENAIKSKNSKLKVEPLNLF